MGSQHFLKFALAAFACCGPLCAADPSAERIKDDVLTLRVQSAIAEDPTLKPHHLNLLVNLVDGMAVIGGELPDMKLMPQIERVVRNVTGVRAVKVSGWLPADSKGGDPFRQRLADQLGTKPSPPAPKMADPAPPPLSILSKPSDPLPEGTSVARRPLVPAGLLMEPVVTGTKVAAMAPGAAPLPYPTIPPPGVPTQPVILPEATSPWEELRRSDPRFTELEAIRREGGYVVMGKASKLTDAWDFATKLQALPGVETVVVGRVRCDQ